MNAGAKLISDTSSRESSKVRTANDISASGLDNSAIARNYNPRSPEGQRIKFNINCAVNNTMENPPARHGVIFRTDRQSLGKRSASENRPKAL